VAINAGNGAPRACHDRAPAHGHGPDPGRAAPCPMIGTFPGPRSTALRKVPLQPRRQRAPVTFAVVPIGCCRRMGLN